MFHDLSTPSGVINKGNISRNPEQYSGLAEHDPIRDVLTGTLIRLRDEETAPFVIWANILSLHP
ncbi:hypothetical protein XI25_19975 [Paenibacillus sp. DMB20]|nr:hypothetical protein XI25_19975 [Paenibacillus sp. DMB20]